MQALPALVVPLDVHIARASPHDVAPPVGHCAVAIGQVACSQTGTVSAGSAVLHHHRAAAAADTQAEQC